jgi:hypothetical protein
MNDTSDMSQEELENWTDLNNPNNDYDWKTGLIVTPLIIMRIISGETINGACPGCKLKVCNRGL